MANQVTDDKSLYKQYGLSKIETTCEKMRIA